MGLFRSFTAGELRGSCFCGARVYVIFAAGSGFILYYNCIYCGGVHQLNISRLDILTGKSFALSCPLQGQPVGHFGPETEVRRECPDFKKKFVRYALKMSADEMTDTDFSSFFALYGYMERVEAAVRGSRGNRPSIKKARSFD
jgi:hypothetical protein